MEGTLENEKAHVQKSKNLKGRDIDYERRIPKFLQHVIVNFGHKSFRKSVEMHAIGRLRNRISWQDKILLICWLYSHFRNIRH